MCRTAKCCSNSDAGCVLPSLKTCVPGPLVSPCCAMCRVWVLRMLQMCGTPLSCGCGVVLLLQCLKDYLGLEKVIWLWRGMEGDTEVVNGASDVAPSSLDNVRPSLGTLGACMLQSAAACLLWVLCIV